MLAPCATTASTHFVVNQSDEGKNSISNEIDQLVYSLYGITENERKIIEWEEGGESLTQELDKN